MIEATESTFDQILKTQGTCLLDFSASRCVPCQSMVPVLRQLEQTSKICVVKVDIERCKDLTAKYGIKSVPTLVFMRDGREVRRVVGAQRLARLQLLIA